ncbi:hypothetical protein Tco_1539732 [Tanacetum coccineum]
MKGKTMATKFDKPSVVRQPNALKISKPSVLGKPTPFSDSLERKSFSKKQSFTKTNVLEGLSKPVTTQILPQTARQAIVQLILFIVDSGCTKHMTGNLKLLCISLRNIWVPFIWEMINLLQLLVMGIWFKEIPRSRGFITSKTSITIFFSVGQFCDADLEVAFRKLTCFVRDLQGNGLLTGNRVSDLYTISL